VPKDSRRVSGSRELLRNRAPGQKKKKLFNTLFIKFYKSKNYVKHELFMQVSFYFTINIATSFVYYIYSCCCGLSMSMGHDDHNAHIIDDNIKIKMIYLMTTYMLHKYNIMF